MEDIHIQRVELFIFSQIFDRQIPALESGALVRRRFLRSQETSKWSSTILLVRGRDLEGARRCRTFALGQERSTIQIPTSRVHVAFQRSERCTRFSAQKGCFSIIDF